MSKYMFIMTAG